MLALQNHDITSNSVAISLRKGTEKLSFATHLNELKNASIEDLKSGKFDGILANALENCHTLDDAKDLSYTLFSGSRLSKFGSTIQLMKYLLVDNQINLDDLKPVILAAFANWKENHRASEAIKLSGTINMWKGFENETYNENESVLLIH